MGAVDLSAAFPGPPDGRLQVHLLGFMGAGKSTVARELARRWNWNYLDLDVLVEREAGCSIAAIFAGRGQAEFRRVERWVLRQAVQKPRTVLALGGGTFADPDNRAICRAAAVTVWLRAPLSVLLQRVAGGEDIRPLLRQSSQRLAELFRQREAAYASAEVVVDAERPAEQVAAAIDARIREA